MKSKILKKIVYDGLGFSVVLTNVPTVKIRGEFVPDINYVSLQKAVLLHLCHKKSPLTGNEVKFIRKYFEMTSTQFGFRFGRTHAAVLKWERYGDDYAKIEPSTDVCIRLFVYSHLYTNGKAFKELYNEIDMPYLAECQKGPSHVVETLSIDVSEELKSA